MIEEQIRIHNEHDNDNSSYHQNENNNTHPKMMIIQWESLTIENVNDNKKKYIEVSNDIQ